MVPASVVTAIWPPLTGKSSVVLAVAGATAVTVMPACLRAADIAGLTMTWVLLPMTVALADVYLVVADVPELVPPVAEVLLAEVPLPKATLLLEPPPQAATPSPAATITAIADSRE
jgi:hypothetical protein